LETLLSKSVACILFILRPIYSLLGLFSYCCLAAKCHSCFRQFIFLAFFNLIWNFFFYGLSSEMLWFKSCYRFLNWVFNLLVFRWKTLHLLFQCKTLWLINEIIFVLFFIHRLRLNLFFLLLLRLIDKRLFYLLNLYGFVNKCVNISYYFSSFFWSLTPLIAKKCKLSNKLDLIFSNFVNFFLMIFLSLKLTQNLSYNILIFFS